MRKKKRPARKKFTAVEVLNQTWLVPRGFGETYRRVLRDYFDSIVDGGEPNKIIYEVIDLLALVGYAATPEQVADWDLRRRVEAVVYAATEYALASDNPGRRHPLPSWLPKDPWRGPPVDTSSIRPDLRGAFAGPSGTPIPTEAT